MGINVVNYWPFDLVNTTKKRTFSYVDPTGAVPALSSTFSYDAKLNALICSDYNDKGIWQDDWIMTCAPDKGVVETADRYPQKNAWLAKIFGSKQIQQLKPPILWGNVVNIGDMITSTPAYDSLGSTPPFCVHGSGFQAVHFEAHLDSLKLHDGSTHADILQFQYSQTWNGKTTGARYWMAKGVGPIAISWIGYNAKGGIVVTEPRCDAVDFSLTT